MARPNKRKASRQKGRSFADGLSALAWSARTTVTLTWAIAKLLSRWAVAAMGLCLAALTAQRTRAILVALAWACDRGLRTLARWLTLPFRSLLAGPRGQTLQSYLRPLGSLYDRAAPAGALVLLASGTMLGLWLSLQVLTPTSIMVAFGDDDVGCMALNIYHEARGEPEDGKIAVGHVVLNRVRDGRFPGKVCDVIRQGGEETRHRCQFSWWCDGRSDNPDDIKAWEESLAFANQILGGGTKDPTGGALWYHADHVAPSWKDKLSSGPQIGRHLFYVDMASAEN